MTIKKSSDINKIIYISPQIYTFKLRMSILQAKDSKSLDIINDIDPIIEDIEDQGEL